MTTKHPILLRVAVGLTLAAILIGATTYIRTRKPILNGTWYPAEPAEIASKVNGYMDSAKDFTAPGRLVAAVIPSAPWALAGPMSGEILRDVVPGAYDRVIVLTGSHASVIEGCSIAAVQFYETPFGGVPMDGDAMFMLTRNVLINSRSVVKNQNLITSGVRRPVHEREYGIEVVLPMLQARLGTFRLIPVVVGTLHDARDTISRDIIDEVAIALKPYVTSKTLIVVTTGFTHYGTDHGFRPFVDNISAKVEQHDLEAIRYVMNRDTPGFVQYLKTTRNPIDGAMALALMMRLLPKNTEAKLHHRVATGDIKGDFEESVSYASIGFYDPSRPVPEPTRPDPAVAVERDRPAKEPEPTGESP